MSRRKLQSRLRDPSFHKLITPPGGVMPTIQTHEIFRHEKSPVTLSPIDRFTENCNGISKLIVQTEYLTKKTPLPSELATMAILGHVSAVESYLRAIFSGLIRIDEYVQLIVERRTLTYGAAMHHKSALLPDALLEGTSFASRDNIREALRDYLRLKVANMPGVDDALKAFQKICEIRHCCVHRFGRLGSNNAISLGLSEHSTLLEARVEPDIDQLQEIFLSLRVLVRSLNASIFYAVIERTTQVSVRDETFPYIYSIQWKWRWPSDRTRFCRYYDLFCSTKDVTPSPSAKDVYESLRAATRR